MNERPKLFRVTCKGMFDSHGCAYVIAVGPTQAYDIVRADLDARDLGFLKDRALDKVELIAEEAEFPEGARRLYL